MNRPFTMFGFSHLFGDIVDCIESIGGELHEVVTNVPEVSKPGRPSLNERVNRLNSFGRSVLVLEFKYWRPRRDWSHVIGFSRSQAHQLLREIEAILGSPCMPVKHKTSITQIGAEVGPWSIVNAGAILGSWSRLGRHVIVNRGANIGHDVEIGDHSFISPGSVICGHAKLGRNVFVGANATILPDIRIGDDATIGAGAVVTSWVEAGMTVAGVPAAEIRKSDP